MNRTPTDDLLATIVDITMTPTQLRSAEAAQKRPQPTCPVCRSPHPSDIACKTGEARDNGGTLTHRSELP